jgi:hypothetical protein
MSETTKTNEEQTNETANKAGHFDDVIGFTRTERGWAGHFICSYKCRFRRNTLLEFNDQAIVVSTVGLMDSSYKDGEIETVGLDRYYETMAFHADKTDSRWKDTDVSREVSFESEWAINEIDAEDKANDMHEKVVNEISKKMIEGISL